MKIFSSLVFALFLPLFTIGADAPTNNPPIADANGPYRALVGTVVIFDGSGSSDPEDDPLTYDWAFGDGTSGSGVSPTHVYAGSGNFTVTLTVGDGEFSDSSVSSAKIFPRPPLAPASPENPTDGEQLKALNDDLSLTLKWQEVGTAEAYYYQYWKEGSGITGENWINKNPDGSLDEGTFIPYSLEFGQRYLWHVSSCADLDENGIIQKSVDFNGDGISESECGDYSSPWSFTYISAIPLPPPALSDPADDQSPGSVFVDWSDVNATSFRIDAKINIPSCNWYKVVWGFFAGGNCDPFKLLADKLNSWFTSLLLPFGNPCSKYDPSCPWLLWDSDSCHCVQIPVLPKQGETRAKAEYLDDACIFSKGEKYKIRVASCEDSIASSCGPFSEKQEFKVGDTLNFDPPKATSTERLMTYDAGPPEIIPVLTRGHHLQWTAHNCSNYVRFILKNEAGTTLIDEKMPNIEIFPLSHEKFNAIFDNSNELDKKYSWQLRSCWRIGDNTLCDEGKISAPWYFRTAGAPPLLLKPANGETTKVPSTLEWKEIEGVDSYFYQVATDGGFANVRKDGYSTSPSVKIDHSIISADSQYWWRVKTCIFKNWIEKTGPICGNQWSEVRNFRTFPLNNPTNLGPERGSLPAALKWDADPGANFYQYKVDYYSTTYQDPNGESLTETLSGCNAGTEVVPRTITSQTGFSLLQNCLGQYRWQVRSCLDQNCGVATPNWEQAPIYNASELVARQEKGIVPCGRSTNNIETPYNERESCQIKHVIFLIQNIIDFLLWRLGLIVALIFAAMTAVISYFSLGGPGTIDRIRAIWKSFGLGYGIMLVSWILVNLILAIAGFQVEFFGRWFELPF